MRRGAVMSFTPARSVVFTLIFFILIPVAVFAGGTPEADSTEIDTPVIELMDYYDRPVILQSPAMKIVSLAPGITETVFALGYGDRLAGRTSYCDYPAEAAAVADMGSLTEPDMELIVATDPDLVIASTHFSEESLAMLENAGLNVAVFMGAGTLEGVYNGVIRPVAEILGDVDAGEILVDSMKETASEARKKAEARTKKPSVYYVVGFGEGGDWTAGGDTFIGQMITLAGGDNIAGDVEGWAFSTEALVNRDPDLIFVPFWADGLFGTSEPYSNLRAVRSGHVVPVDENAIVRQGPRLAEGYAYLVDAMGITD